MSPLKKKKEKWLWIAWKLQRDCCQRSTETLRSQILHCSRTIPRFSQTLVPIWCPPTFPNYPPSPPPCSSTQRDNVIMRKCSKTWSRRVFFFSWQRSEAPPSPTDPPTNRHENPPNLRPGPSSDTRLWSSVDSLICGQWECVCVTTECVNWLTSDTRR